MSADLDSLEGSLLEAYQPPASIDRHPDFIAISAAIKEARELNDAGLRYGALLRYLQAARRLAMLTSPASADTNGLAVQLEQMSRRLASGKIDHSIGRLFLETAWAAPDSNAKEAVAIVKDVLPRYFVALQPAPPSAPRPPAEATVTLVRWPYT